MSELAVRGRPFQPGVSGNPNGRPVGHRTRHQFSASFLADLAEVWAEHGRETMLRTAKTSPETFFATCARLLPKDVELTIRQHYTGLDESDLMILRAIRDAIPNANELEPQAVRNTRSMQSELTARDSSLPQTLKSFKSLVQFVLSLMLSAHIDFGKIQGR